MNELKETLAEEIEYLRNKLNKPMKETTRQYLLGRLTSLEVVLERLEMELWDDRTWKAWKL